MPSRDRPRRQPGGQSVLKASARTFEGQHQIEEEIRIGRLLYPPVDVARPRTRGDCAGGERPCPFVGCSQHLYLDVQPDTGSITLNHPGLEPWELAETCALDVADRGGCTLEEVGDIAGVTRERIRQLEARALRRIRKTIQHRVTGNNPAEAIGLLSIDDRGDPWDEQ